MVQSGGKLLVTLSVQNTGSAPMYYDWPIEVSLLEPLSREPAWKSTFKNVDVRKWLPGEFSDEGKGKQVGDKTHTTFEWNTGLDYDVPARTNEVSQTFRLPRSLPKGEYILAIAILDPAGNLPCARFAIQNYFRGGWHPLGRIGIGMLPSSSSLPDSAYDDPAQDRSLHYVVP
jgi:hypothetical protein